MKDLNYVIGRLQGLNELVRILRDLVEREGENNSEIIANVTEHISVQLESILSEFDEMPTDDRQKYALRELKKKHGVEKKRPDEEEEVAEEVATDEAEESPRGKLERHEKTVDELLRDLESLKAQ